MDENLVSGGVTPADPVPDTTVAPQAAPDSGQPRNDAGQFAPTGGEASQPAAPEVPQSFTVTAVEMAAIEQAQRDAETARSQLAVYQKAAELGNFQQPAPAPAYQPAPVDPDPLAGLADTEVVDVGQVRQLLQREVGNINSQLQSVAQQTKQNAFIAQNPGAVELMQQNLPGIIQHNPGLMNVIKTSADPLQTAYEFARMSQTQQPAAPTAPDLTATLATIKANALKPGSASAAAGAGGGGISTASKISNMSDAEFAVYKQEVMNGQRRVGQ